MSLAVELGIIVALVLVNGVFAGAEIAALSVRKTRIAELEAEGLGSARALAEMRREPERFLATVQIGITVVSATAAAFGGRTIAALLARFLVVGGLSENAAEDVALAVVIAGVSYLSLVLGELVPKSLALRWAERYALFIARPLLLMSRLASPLVWMLTKSSNLILRFFKDATTFTEARFSKEELQQLVDEAANVGALDRHTSEIAYRALDFGDLRVGAVMVPRAEIIALRKGATREEVRDTLLAHGHERMPVYDESPENIIGYVTARDLFAVLLGSDRNLDTVVRPPLFAPETRRATNLLADMQRTRDHLALVVDEQGSITGLVTLEDLVEEIVGEIFAEHEAPDERIRREPGGTVLIRGRTPVSDVNRELGLELPERPDYVTVAGLAISLAHGIPAIGAKLDAGGGMTLEIVEATDRRVSSVRLTLPRPAER